MGHVAIFGDYLQTFDGFCVTHDIIEVDGAVFLNPTKTSVT